MTRDEQSLDALERAMIGLSSGLQGLERGSTAYEELKVTIDRIYEDWRVLNLKVNPLPESNDISDLL